MGLDEDQRPRQYVAVDPEERLELLLRDLRTSRDGLSGREAQRRLVQFGSNLLVSLRELRGCGMPPLQARDLVFSGTTCTEGEGRAVVGV